MEEEAAAPGRISRVVARAYLVLCLVYMAWIMWAVLMPEHRRQQMKLRLLRSSARVTRALARRAGAASLSHEARTGVEDYALPYRLSLVTESLERSYDRARGVIC